MASGLQIVVMEFTQFASECIVVRVEDQGSLGLFLTIGRYGARQGNDIQQAAAGKEYEPSGRQINTSATMAGAPFPEPAGLALALKFPANRNVAARIITRLRLT